MDNVDNHVRPICQNDFQLYSKRVRIKGSIICFLYLLLIIGIYATIFLCSSYDNLNKNLKLVKLDNQILCEKFSDDLYDCSSNITDNLINECKMSFYRLEICLDFVNSINQNCGQYISDYVIKKKENSKNLKQYENYILECIPVRSNLKKHIILTLVDYLNNY